MPDAMQWQLAVNFAAKAHRHHTRKDGATPYVAHVFRVALTLRHYFECSDVTALTAALLHDTIEDTTTDYDDVAEQFGQAVADCVAAMTKNMILPEAEREADYDRRLLEGPWQARLIKLADSFDNLADSLPSNSGASVAKTLDRCRRTLALAQGDAERPEFGRAIRLMQQAVSAAEARIKPTR
jgi:guanosine-3',5'-bis(diphosphate) 3'-pyrophosphohydrolase